MQQIYQDRSTNFPWLETHVPVLYDVRRSWSFTLWSRNCVVVYEYIVLRPGINDNAISRSNCCIITFDHRYCHIADTLNLCGCPTRRLHYTLRLSVRPSIFFHVCNSTTKGSPKSRYRFSAILAHRDALLPRDAMHSADYAPTKCLYVRLFVCLSARPSVTCRYSVETASARHIYKHFPPLNSHTLY